MESPFRCLKPLLLLSLLALAWAPLPAVVVERQPTADTTNRSAMPDPTPAAAPTAATPDWGRLPNLSKVILSKAEVRDCLSLAAESSFWPVVADAAAELKNHSLYGFAHVDPLVSWDFVFQA